MTSPRSCDTCVIDFTLATYLLVFSLYQRRWSLLDVSPFQALIFIDQRRQLSGLAAFVNLMCQIGTVVNTLGKLSQSWPQWNVNGGSLWTTIEIAMDKSGQSLFPRLISEPLANLLSDKRSLLPLQQLTQSLLELLTHLTLLQPGETPQSSDIKSDAMAYMRIIVKVSKHADDSGPNLCGLCCPWV